VENNINKQTADILTVTFIFNSKRHTNVPKNLSKSVFTLRHFYVILQL